MLLINNDLKYCIYCLNALFRINYTENFKAWHSGSECSNKKLDFILFITNAI